MAEEREVEDHNSASDLLQTEGNTSEAPYRDIQGEARDFLHCGLQTLTPLTWL